MDFEQIQQVWSKMDNELQKQKKMTDKIILDMTQERYTGKFQKIRIIESLGAMICIIAGIVLMFSFNRLDTWYLQLLGAITILYLFILPITVLRSLYQIQKVKIESNNFKQTLSMFYNAKNRLLIIQKIGIFSNFIIVLIFTPVLFKIMDGDDIFTKGLEGWYWVFPLAFVVMALISYWGYKCYLRITNSAENILNDLDMD